MAGHNAAIGILEALKDSLSSRMTDLLGKAAAVKLIDSDGLKTLSGGEGVGLYLYRLAVDPFSRNRHLPPAEGHRSPRPELPVNLHILLIGLGESTESEIRHLTAAMQVIGSAMNLGAADLITHDPDWSESESVQIIPEEMSTEDLSRLWESFTGGYRLSIPYIIKTVRLLPDRVPEDEVPVKTLVYPFLNNAGTTA